MSRTFTNLLTHIIFSTKDRMPVIQEQLRPELYAYLGGLTRELKGRSYGINGTAITFIYLSAYLRRLLYRTLCAF
jgi:putative transposase